MYIIPHLRNIDRYCNIDLHLFLEALVTINYKLFAYFLKDDRQGFGVEIFINLIVFNSKTSKIRMKFG